MLPYQLPAFKFSYPRFHSRIDVSITVFIVLLLAGVFAGNNRAIASTNATPGVTATKILSYRVPPGDSYAFNDDDPFRFTPYQRGRAPVFSRLTQVPYSENNRLNWQFFKALFADTGHVLSSPVRWNIEDWLTFTAVVGTTVGLTFADDELRDWTQRDQTDTGKLFADIGTYFGSGTNVIVTFSGFYLAGELFKNNHARRTALLGFESALITSLITQSLKFTFHRHRPFTGDPPDTFDGPSFAAENLSLPSGHSTAAFSIATVIATEYKRYPIIPPLAYGMAVLTAYSRMHKNVHWASDVFAGFAVGYFTSKTVLNLHSKTHNVTLVPGISGDSLGVSVLSRY